MSLIGCYCSKHLGIGGDTGHFHKGGGLRHLRSTTRDMQVLPPASNKTHMPGCYYSWRNAGTLYNQGTVQLWEKKERDGNVLVTHSLVWSFASEHVKLIYCKHDMSQLLPSTPSCRRSKPSRANPYGNACRAPQICNGMNVFETPKTILLQDVLLKTNTAYDLCSQGLSLEKAKMLLEDRTWS